MRKKLYPSLRAGNRRHSRMDRRVASLESLESRVLLSAAVAADADPVTVDLMVVYTPAARDAAGGTAAMVNLIQQDLAYANQTLANSQVAVKLRLVYSGGVDYTESGNASADLASLSGASDGQMDAVHSIRDAVGADLVTLYTASRDADAGGLAYVLTDPTLPDNDTRGFSVVGLPNNATPGALIHELGHNFGAAHDGPHNQEGGAFAYSQGYNFTVDGVPCGDVMSNAPVTRLPYFSNPDVEYKGVPTGAAAANNAATLSATAPIVAAYRTRDASLPVASLVAGPAPKDGAPSYTFTVRYRGSAGIDPSTLGDGDVRLTGPFGYAQAARLVSYEQADDSTLTATYRVSAPGGAWTNSANGQYAVTLLPGEVQDNNGASPAQGDLGLVDAQIGDLPDFAPLAPPNWSGSIVVATGKGTTSDAKVIYDDQELYVDRAMNNAAPNTRLSQTMYDDLYVDGVYRTTYATRPQDINPYGGVSNLDFNIGRLAPGKHTITVVLDSRGLIDEADETNNTYSHTFTVSRRPAPELSVTLASDGSAIQDNQAAPVDFGSVTAGATPPRIAFVVHNTGTADLATSALSLPDGYTIINPLSATIAPGESDTFSIELSSSAAGLHAGTVSFTSNDANESPFAFTVTGSVAPPKADLAPFAPAGWSAPAVVSASAGAMADGAALYSDQNLLLNLALRNAGAADAATPFHTLVFIDGQQVADLQSLEVPAGSSSSYANVKLGTLAAGKHTIRVDVDATSAIDESNESNNSYTRTITVANRPAKPKPPAKPPVKKDLKAPTATLKAAPAVGRTAGVFKFTVTYGDNVAIRFKTISTGDALVVGPHGFRQYAKYVSATRRADGTPITVTYSIVPPGRSWDWRENGIYTIKLLNRQVSDTSGNYAAAKVLGKFKVNVPHTRTKFSTRSIPKRA